MIFYRAIKRCYAKKKKTYRFADTRRRRGFRTVYKYFLSRFFLFNPVRPRLIMLFQTGKRIISRTVNVRISKIFFAAASHLGASVVTTYLYGGGGDTGKQSHRTDRATLFKRGQRLDCVGITGPPQRLPGVPSPGHSPDGI